MQVTFENIETIGNHLRDTRAQYGNELRSVAEFVIDGEVWRKVYPSFLNEGFVENLHVAYEESGNGF